MVDARVLVGTTELEQLVLAFRFLQVVVRNHNCIAGDRRDRARVFCKNQVGAVACCTQFHAGSDVRRFCAQQWNGLTLHVGTHQRAVGVVVLKERNQCGCNRNDLLGRNVDEVDFGAWYVSDVGGGTEEALGFQHLLQVVQAGCLRRTTHKYAITLEGVVGIQWRVGLGNDVVLFFVGWHVHDFVGDLAVANATVWALDETKWVDARVRGQRTNQTNVWTFWCLNWAHTAVVRKVDVADFETCALAAEATRPKCRQTTTVRKTRQWVYLVHKLRQLRSSEELFNRSNNWTHVNKCLWRNGFHVLGSHALAHHSLHT
ncbi:unannotated protein [freshwater metagenome]|uniref:Unannotated protein n=1 Tax=freshwater metagenome TaxID=449393 RepID=A0A6J6KQD7_9ZZZZ